MQLAGNAETSRSPKSSPAGAADDSPGRKSGVDQKKETDSTLPKAVAGERSSQATLDADNSIDLSARKGRGPQDDNAKTSVPSVSSAVKDVAVFKKFVRAGHRIAKIHVHYEDQPEYPLTKVEKPGEKLDYRVTKMKLSKDKTSLIYNHFLTLSGIPPETYEYRLGNRSALEWVIDQYQVSTDKRSGITNDPNRHDNETYILRLIGQVITVSLETVKIVNSLPPLGLPE
jgi:hypothetical protein